MKNAATTRTHFIYEADNIPDHRSRRFGCSPCLMAVRWFLRSIKKAASEQSLRHGRCKMNPTQINERKGDYPMKSAATTHTHFIYEADNIPDHRSRRFGCSPCLMAVRWFFRPIKKAASEQPLRYGRCKMNPTQIKSVLPLYHTTSA